jgi:heme oxygenase
MSLKDLTKDSHTAAEKTKFMKAVFKNQMPAEIWTDWLYQKSLFYNAIESCADSAGLLIGMSDLKRTFALLSDYRSMFDTYTRPSYRKTTLNYYQYIMNLYPDRDRIMAHLYVWHMGDLHGGQMIKKIVAGSHRSLEFDRRDTLITLVRQQLDDSMAAEANIAFDWAIQLMNEYDTELGT